MLFHVPAEALCNRANLVKPKCFGKPRCSGSAVKECLSIDTLFTIQYFFPPRGLIDFIANKHQWTCLADMFPYMATEVVCGRSISVSVYRMYA